MPRIIQVKTEAVKDLIVTAARLQTGTKIKMVKDFDSSDAKKGQACHPGYSIPRPLPVVAGIVAVLIYSVALPLSQQNSSCDFVTEGPRRGNVLTLIAHTSMGQVRLQGANVLACAKKFNSYVQDHNLSTREVGPARVYAENYRQLATVHHGGRIVLEGRDRL